MWLYTQHGHLSVVQDKDGRMLVRAREGNDIRRCLDAAGMSRFWERIQYTPFADYAWRVKLSRGQTQRLLARLARDIDYSNFKDQASTTLGREYVSGLLSEIWYTCLDHYGTGRYAWNKKGKL